MTKLLCEDTLAHDGSTQIPPAVFTVVEYMGSTDSLTGQNDLTGSEYNVCAPCAKFLTSNKWLRVHMVRPIMDEATQLEANASGQIVDPVPVGSDKPEGSFGGVTSVIRRSERRVRLAPNERNVRMHEALLNEVTRLTRRRVDQAARRTIEGAWRKLYDGAITQAECDRIVSEALATTLEVSLDKRG